MTETKWWIESRELRAQLSGHERQLLPQPGTNMTLMLLVTTKLNGGYAVT
jgi:hypothetical protein